MNLLFAAALFGCWGVASCADNSKTTKEPAMSIQITSTAFSEGQPIPQKYTCEGSDISPPLAWTQRPCKHQKLRAHRRRSRRAGGHLGALGALRFAGDHDWTRREDCPSRRQLPGGAKQGLNDLAAPGLRRAVSAARQTASLFLQTLRARHDARPETRPDEEGFAQGDGRPRPRRGAVDGDVSKTLSDR